MKHSKTWQAPSTAPLPINTGTETLHTTADWNVSRALPFSLFLFHPLAWAENADRSMDARWLGQYKDTPVLSPTPMSFSCEHMWQLNRQIERKYYHENKTHPPPTEKYSLPGTCSWPLSLFTCVRCQSRGQQNVAVWLHIALGIAFCIDYVDRHLAAAHILPVAWETNLNEQMEHLVLPLLIPQ